MHGEVTVNLTVLSVFGEITYNFQQACSNIRPPITDGVGIHPPEEDVIAWIEHLTFYILHLTFYTLYYARLDEAASWVVFRLF